MNEISFEIVEEFDKRLNRHPIYGEVKSLTELRIFMEHHVFSVWDYMSIIKYLQHEIAPTTYPWVPKGQGNIRRFINELVMGEESDKSLKDGEFVSHFELYLSAMEEIGANTNKVRKFVEVVMEKGLKVAFSVCDIPLPSRNFMENTFSLIHSNKPHEVAAALALGREHIIPVMFKSLLAKMSVTEQDAPTFYYYLSRHIQLDGESHGPLSMQLLNGLCNSEKQKIAEAVKAVDQAINCRLKFWDEVNQQICAVRIQK